MPEYQDNEFDGVLFWNEDKPNENYPDVSGHIYVNGAEIKLVGWERTSERTGKRYLKFVKSVPRTDEPQPKPESGKVEPQDESKPVNLDDIPF